MSESIHCFGQNSAVGGLKYAPEYPDKPAVDPWVHRQDGMRCRTCIWWLPKDRITPTTLNAPTVGRCRRHAPTVGGYPVVFATDWCGDHRLDENKV